MPKKASYMARVILLLLAIPAGTEEAILWGAMATNVKGDQGREAANVYGASWNYPTIESAENAAVKACNRQASKAGVTPNCWSHSLWKNGCFVIFKSKHPVYGTSFHPGGETRGSMVEMRRYAERMLIEGGPGGDRSARLSIDLLKCMGASGQ